MTPKSIVRNTEFILNIKLASQTQLQVVTQALQLSNKTAFIFFLSTCNWQLWLQKISSWSIKLF